MAFYNEVWCVVTFISYHQLFSLSLFFWRVSTDLSNLIVFQHISRLTFLLEVAYHTNVFQVWLETFCGKIQSRLHVSLRNETIIYITYIYIYNAICDTQLVSNSAYMLIDFPQMLRVEMFQKSRRFRILREHLYTLSQIDNHVLYAIKDCKTCLFQLRIFSFSYVYRHWKELFAVMQIETALLCNKVHM